MCLYSYNNNVIHMFVYLQLQCYTHVCTITITMLYIRLYTLFCRYTYGEPVKGRAIITVQLVYNMPNLTQTFDLEVGHIYVQMYGLQGWIRRRRRRVDLHSKNCFLVFPLQFLKAIFFAPNCQQK